MNFNSLRKHNMALMCIYKIILISVFFNFTGCHQKNTSVRNVFFKHPFLMLSQAQFKTIKTENGDESSVPGAARLELIFPSGEKWETVVIEDGASNVFHKASVFTPRGKSPGILTIGANKAMLKLWRPQKNGNWAAETL